MLINPNSYLYIYTIQRDFGFAPNPFHGFCTLATCKPHIRNKAKENDWILGISGRDLEKYVEYRNCILLMKVSEKVDFQEYWDDPRFSRKKPARNGSNKQMNGDNIYHKNAFGQWVQEDSHHANSDGSLNLGNLQTDVLRHNSNNVLISNNFFYFGNQAIPINIDSIISGGIRGHLKINLEHDQRANSSRKLIETVCNNYQDFLNQVVSDPCQFEESYKVVDQTTGKFSWERTELC